MTSLAATALDVNNMVPPCFLCVMKGGQPNIAWILTTNWNTFVRANLNNWSLVTELGDCWIRFGFLAMLTWKMWIWTARNRWLNVEWWICRLDKFLITGWWNIAGSSRKCQSKRVQWGKQPWRVLCCPTCYTWPPKVVSIALPRANPPAAAQRQQSSRWRWSEALHPPSSPTPEA